VAAVFPSRDRCPANLKIVVPPWSKNTVHSGEERSAADSPSSDPSGRIPK